MFQDFNEEAIRFAPTYKYDLFSEDYDTSEKCRVPAWTDRVLWRRRKPVTTTGHLSEVKQGSCFWYGRAELKQSDHRPVLAIIDVEVLKLDVAKRETVFEQALKVIGPPDGSILLQVGVCSVRNDSFTLACETHCLQSAKFESIVSFDVQNVIDDHFMKELVERLEAVGKIRFTKFVNEMIWVAFMDHAKALDAVKLGAVQVRMEKTCKGSNCDGLLALVSGVRS